MDAAVMAGEWAATVAELVDVDLDAVVPCGFCDQQATFRVTVRPCGHASTLCPLCAKAAWKVLNGDSPYCTVCRESALNLEMRPL
ncbi:MAG: hypothetical protein H7Y33_03965 [Cytophagales bacterium]|nr:hypothetical protein [Rhizobacter sp.]